MWKTHGTFICFLYSAPVFKVDRQSFLFTLISPTGTQSIKLSAKSSAELHNAGGILCRTSMGPCFGDKDHFDLKLTDAVEGYDYHLAGSTAFICPSNVTRTFTPENHFNISELEIFKVNFES